MAKVFVPGKGWLDEEAARQLAQQAQVGTIADLVPATPMPSVSGQERMPLERAALRADENAVREAQRIDDYTPPPPDELLARRNMQLRSILKDTPTTGEWTRGDEGRPKLSMQGNVPAQPAAAFGSGYEEALRQQTLGNQDQFYRQKQRRDLMEIMNGNDPVKRNAAFKMMQELERQPMLGASRGSSLEEQDKMADIEYKRAQTKKLGQVETPKAEWGTVESGGKIYQINKNTGEIRPATVGEDQLVGKEGKKLDPVAKREGALMALTTAGYDPETGQDRVEALINQSTSGGLQKGGAATARFFDVTTSGGKAIQALKTISNSITLDQLNGKLGAGISNADVDFLRKTVGDVANEDLTAEERLAAWKEARSRLERFAEVGKGKPAPAAQAGSTTAKPPMGGQIERSTSKSGKPIFKRPGSNQWEYE